MTTASASAEWVAFDHLLTEALRAFVRGNPEPYQQLWSTGEDVTIFGGWGAYERGAEAVRDRLTWAASRYRDGWLDREPLSHAVDATIAHSVDIEHSGGRFDGSPHLVQAALRVTHHYRREPGGWRVTHRHADFLTPRQQPSSTPPTRSTDPRAVVAAFDRAVDTGDFAALDAVCHPDMVTHSFGPTMPQGISGMRRFVAERAASGGVGHWDQVQVISDDEHVVQFGVRSQTWPGGPFRGFDVAAGPVTRDCAFLFRVADGLITDRWAIRDDLAMLAQLGAVTPARPDGVTHGTTTSQHAAPFARNPDND